MAPAAILCKEKRRDSVGDDFPCDTPLVDYAGLKQCPVRADHVRPFKTGFCSSGFCEGTKARSFSGVPAMTCKFWLVCSCDCHAKLSQIFKITGQPRILVENPEYQHPKITGMLTFDERAKLHAEHAEQARADRAARMIDEPDGGTEIYSPSGRTRKGLLDEWVELQCQLWALTHHLQEHDCTPALIAQQIAAVQDVPEPSHGAVDAVLRRWTAYGYATMEAKPTRFTGFTEEGQRLGLEVLKQKRKLQKTSFSAGRR